MFNNNHIYNSINESKSTSMNDLLNEIERGDSGYVEKHKSIATVYRVMSGGKKLQVKLGKTGKKVVIDAKDIDILPESTTNEQSRQLKDKNKEMMVVKDGNVIVIDKKDWKKYQKKGYLVAEESAVNEAAKPSQVRSAISREKKKLMKKWAQKGGYENFGQKEVSALERKFKPDAFGSSEEREIARMIQDFDNWAMNYTGDMRESTVNEASGEFVVYIERDNGRKKLLHTKKSQRAANMFMSKNMDKILNTSGIRSIGSMSKDQWEKTEARFAENIKKSDMKTISKKEWDRKHKDFKGIVKGQPYMMYYDKDTQSTVYGPVNIKESINERKPSKIVFDNRKLSAAKRINARNWYMKTFPTDELGAEIDKRISLLDVYEKLSKGVDAYKIIGVNDSVVRERIFEKLSKVLGLDYDVIYNMWESVVNEAGNLKMSSSQMKQLHKAFDKTSDDDFRRAMFSVVKRDKFIKLIRDFDKSSLQNLVKMKPNAPFSKAVQAYLDGKIKEGLVNERKYVNQTGVKTALLRDTQFKNLVSPKEQKWIKGNDVKIFAAIGRSKFIFTDGKLEMVMSPLRPFELLEPLGRASNEIKKVYQQNESVVNEGKKAFKVNPQIGKAKYSISFHDGKSKNKDGSDFWGIDIFKNKVDLEKAIKNYKSKGFVAESVVNEKKVPKKGSPDYHQHKIAVDTVKNPRKSFMGGPSATEAEETLMDKFGYSKKEIEKLKESVVNEGVKKGKRYGDWTVTSYEPLQYDDYGAPFGGKIKITNQKTFDTLLIQNDLNLRGSKWFVSVNRRTIQDKNPETVIQQAIKKSVNESLLTEATRSQVGIIDKSGNIISSYVHYDGYPQGVGKTLKQAYNGAKTKQLLKTAGKDGISVLDKDIKGAPDHSFENPVKGQTIFYGRDRGDRGNDMMAKGNINNLEKYLKDADSSYGAEYVYLYDMNGNNWVYADLRKNKKELFPL